VSVPRQFDQCGVNLSPIALFGDMTAPAFRSTRRRVEFESDRLLAASKAALRRIRAPRLSLGLGRTVLVASSIVIAAGLVVVQLDVAERQATTRELQLGRVAALIQSVASQQWQALALGQEDQRALADFRKTWADANARLAELKSLAPSDRRLSGVGMWIEAFVSDVHQELTFVSSGSMVDAERFERSSVLPVLSGLTATLASAQSAYSVDARRAASDKAIYSLLTVAISALFLTVLVWMARRSQLQVERRFRSLIQHSTDVFSVLSPSGEVLYESPAVEAVLGFLPDERVGTNVLEGIHPEDRPSVDARLEQMLRAKGGEASAEFRYRHSDGTWRRIEAFGKNLIHDSAVGGIAVNYRDITERRDLEDQLRRQAFEDPLTGLANRALLRDRLEHAIERTRRSSDSRVVMFFLDLDDFKKVNDSLGHVAGDALLTMVAQRIRGSVRGVDTVARLGGDEFAVLAEDVEDANPEELGHRLLDALAPPFAVSGEEVFVRASVGFASSTPSDDGEILLRNADLAMYQAKAEGKGGMRRYDSGLHHSAVARLALDRDLRHAVENHEFAVQYQPIVALESRRIVGLEALVRWAHPVRGWLLPDHFIPAAEESGVIVELGRWVLTEACRQMAEWVETGVSPSMSVSVNVSARQLQDPGFPDDVANALRVCGLDGRRLTLEITESILVDDSEAIIARLAVIRALGVRIAIDDFGTGFSSLGYLSRFPVDVLKIDRRFVAGMDTRSADLAVIQAAVGIAASLGLETVAEGVEESQQTSMLHDLGCNLGQGYLFARPGDPSLLEAMFDRPTTHAIPRDAARAPATLAGPGGISAPVTTSPVKV
jgi:diguanylate cyclase (GGDEF)-like protein/PAS domain S-box-containing protein